MGNFLNIIKKLEELGFSYREDLLVIDNKLTWVVSFEKEGYTVIAKNITWEGAIKEALSKLNVL